MPELPEVETVRRGLEPALVGRRIAHVHLARKDLRKPFPKGFAANLTGRRIERLGRRAKYLRIDLDDGRSLIIHLGMSGRLTLTRERGTRPATSAHDHVVISLDDGRALVFNDPRRFGLMTLAATEGIASDPLFRRLGLEPFDGELTGRTLWERLAKRRTSLKAALMDQSVIAGIGNIYACEALHRAQLSPKRSTRGLGLARASKLAKAVKTVLGEAIEAGGSSLRDYVRSDGSPGYFQHRFAVYDREGEPCPRRGCEGHIRRIVQSNRSTFYCPACQR